MVISAKDFGYFEKYMDSKFDGVHLQIESVKKQHDQISGQIDELWKSVDKIKETENAHQKNCINTRQISVISKQVEELEFIKKYYKIFIYALGFLAIIVVAGVMATVADYNEIKKIEATK